MRSGACKTVAVAAAITLLLCGPAPSLAGADRIVLVKGTKKVVGFSPTTGASRVLFRMRRGYITAIAASGDGRQIAVVATLPPRSMAKDGHRVRPERIWVMAGDGDDAHVVKTYRNRASDLAQIESVDFSQNGHRIAVATRDWIAVIRPNGSATRKVKTPGSSLRSGGATTPAAPSSHQTDSDCLAHSEPSVRGRLDGVA